MRTKVVNSGGYTIVLIAQKYAGILIAAFGYHKGGAVAWLQIHQSESPANGTVPLHTFAIGAADNFSVIVPVTGIPFSPACTFVLSTTADTLTSAVSADVWITAMLEAN